MLFIKLITQVITPRMEGFNPLVTVRKCKNGQRSKGGLALNEL